MMSGELSEGLQELWDLYRAALREADRQGISELLRRKDTVQEITLETGQKIWVAYDQNSDEPISPNIRLTEEGAMILNEQEQSAQTDQQEHTALAEQEIYIRVLPCCGNTMLQITVTLPARLIHFTHGPGGPGTRHCSHVIHQGKQTQAILRDGEYGRFTLDVRRAGDFPNERHITFQVLDLELADLDNPYRFPLKIEVKP